MEQKRHSSLSTSVSLWPVLSEILFRARTTLYHLPFALYLPSMSHLSFSAAVTHRISRGVFPPIYTISRLLLLPTFRLLFVFAGARVQYAFAPLCLSLHLLRLPMAAIWYQSNLIAVPIVFLRSDAFRLLKLGYQPKTWWCATYNALDVEYNNFCKLKGNKFKR